MKSKILPIVFAFITLLVVNNASAYYRPSTGRWLSRDPNGEPGFEAFRVANTVPRVAQITVALPPSRLMIRDVIATQNEPNRFVFVMNNPICSIDFFGLYTASVGNCEVVVLYGHGSSSKPHTFTFASACSSGQPSCSAAWFVGCYSKTTDDLIPSCYQIPGAPPINDVLNTGPNNRDDPDTSFDVFFDNTWAAAKAKAKDICSKCCCKSVTVRSELVGSRFAPDNWGFQWPKSEKVECSKKSK